MMRLSARSLRFRLDHALDHVDVGLMLGRLEVSRREISPHAVELLVARQTGGVQLLLHVLARPMILAAHRPG